MSCNDFGISINSRLYVLENAPRAGNFGDDMTFLDDEDPQLFRRSGIIAAFENLEQAKRLAYF